MALGRSPANAKAAPHAAGQGYAGGGVRAVSAGVESSPGLPQDACADEGGEDDEQSASERAQQRAEAMVADELAAYRLAERRLAVARDGLHSALGRAMEAGHTPYRLAQVTGLSQAWIGRLRRGRDSAR